MEILNIITIVCFIFMVALFLTAMTLDIIEQIKLAKLRKKWAAEQERAKRYRNMKLGFCRKCPSKANGTDYFGQPCIYNSEWLCEGPPAPERPITIEVKRAQDWARITRCKDCISWENNYCSTLKKSIYNPDWFCCSGMRKRRDK